MSVQSEITRISGNITAALAAIADKGVNVPDGSNSDALAELIASIEAGGGGGNKTLAYGEFTPAIDCGAIEIEHGLGVQPKMFVEIEQFDDSDFKQYDNMFSFFAEKSDGKVLIVAARHSGSNPVSTSSMQITYKRTYSDLSTGSGNVNYGQVKMANETKVVVGNSSSFYIFRGGKKIYWVAKG